jgi:hypothetical protein
MPAMMKPNEMEVIVKGVRKEETPARITATLYELIVAFQDVMGLDNDALVIATVVHLLRSGKLTFLGKARTICTGRGMRCGNDRCNGWCTGVIDQQ